MHCVTYCRRDVFAGEYVNMCGDALLLARLITQARILKSF